MFEQIEGSDIIVGPATMSMVDQGPKFRLAVQGDAVATLIRQPRTCEPSLQVAAAGAGQAGFRG
jgi:hypothetical protein